MKRKPKPSPLLPPWQVAQYGEHLRPVVVKGSHKIANFWTNENAAYAVKAVNAHAGLVAALTALANVAGERGMDRAVMSQLVAEARAALRAAGEEV